jgi:mediator of RNA polymerase II transcription subunit 17, fungi type
MLQYRVFCTRLDLNLRKAITALDAVGIPTTFSFTPVGEAGEDLISVFCDRGNKTIGGETVIRIDHWYVIVASFNLIYHFV